MPGYIDERKLKPMQEWRGSDGPDQSGFTRVIWRIVRIVADFVLIVGATGLLCTAIFWFQIPPPDVDPKGHFRCRCFVEGILNLSVPVFLLGLVLRCICHAVAPIKKTGSSDQGPADK